MSGLRFLGFSLPWGIVVAGAGSGEGDGAAAANEKAGRSYGWLGWAIGVPEVPEGG